MTPADPTQNRSGVGHAPVRPVVIGTAMNYDRATLTPFLASCRRCIPEATIVLFVCGLSSDTLRWLRDLGVEVVIEDFNPPSHLSGARLVAHQCRLSLAFRLTRLVLGRTANGRESSRRAAEALFSVVTQRFYRYRQYLQSWGDRFTHVVLADVRDVVFQSSPFPCAGLHVFAERESIGQSHFAKRWFFLSYGPRSWRPVKDCPLLNVGTTLGETAAMLKYLDCMCAEFDRRLAFFWGADTAMHNHVIHQGLVEATLHEYGDGQVITLNAIPATELAVANGILLNSRGEPYPLVHQYDRVHGLVLIATQNDWSHGGHP